PNKNSPTNATQTANSSSNEKPQVLKPSDINYHYRGSLAPEWYGRSYKKEGRYRASGYGQSSKKDIVLNKARLRAKRHLAILKGLAIKQDDGTVTISGTLSGIRTVHQHIVQDNGTFYGFVMLEAR
ncbi:MAG: hypothetical protein ABEK50_07515, partial [bacterium]